MATFLKNIFGSEPSMGRKSGSFNDFSLHTGEDAEAELESSKVGQRAAPMAKENTRPRRTNVWQDTFSPGMNSNMKRVPGTFYDAPSKDVDGNSKSVWEHILKADFVKNATFNEFDVNKDGMIDATDLRTKLGPDANVEALIKQADRNGDGKISQSEFCELLKKM